MMTGRQPIAIGRRQKVCVTVFDLYGTGGKMFV